MNGIPQPDGSLRVADPDEATRYDLGNAALYARFNGCGEAGRIQLAEGLFAGAWRLRIEVDGAPFRFQAARAIGRLWELHGERDGLQVRLNTFLEPDSPAVFQACQVSDWSGRARRFAMTFYLDFSRPVSWPVALLSGAARHVPRLPGLGWLWGWGLAKVIQPPSPGALQALPGGMIRVQGTGELAWGATQPPVRLSVSGRVAEAHYAFDLAGEQPFELAWALVAGGERTLEAALERQEEALQSAQSYAAWLSAGLSGGDPLLRSLFVAGLNAAVAAFKAFPGGFAGLVAGPDYAYPPRLYFRDGYWTAQVLLACRPDLVRRHLLSLARGVHVDGRCPSGVFAPHLLRAWGWPGAMNLDWLPDHLDSPAFFVLLLDEYLRAARDLTLLQEQLPLPSSWREAGAQARPWTVWKAARQALFYLIGRDRDGDGLIEKANAPDDWADNVRRGIWVTYDQALYVAALLAGERLAQACREKGLAERFRLAAGEAQRALNHHLWDPQRGHYLNYRRPGFSEAHFSIDSLLALYYGLADEERARRALSAARRLQTHYNPDQPYGDWGVMCVFPPYARRRDLFEKSAQPYRYHNGADWPVWDGVYAAVLHAQGDSEWRYVLTRWWEYGLECGWLTPVEYYSPPYPPGGLLQGWSSLPAAVLARILT